MKRFYLLLLSAVTALTVIAAPLTPQQALSRLGTDNNARRFQTNSLQLVYTASETPQPAYYVFNKADQGYIITGADDLQAPLLAYCDNGTFNYQEIPDAMKEWLEGYALELEYARSLPQIDNSRLVVTPRPVRQPINALVKTRWNQGNPYNMLCPTYGTTKTVTGCVATAMAQVMGRWKYPEKGIGSHSYTHNGYTHSCNFANTTFDWANMDLYYNGNTTARQDSAIAVLMSACGISVDMQYGASSGAYTRDVVPALINYFGYAPSSTYHSRTWYGLYEWEDLVYSSLSHKCPCLYNGRGSLGGHAFVVDGYEGDGYFHLNWGWSGSSDGYFLLTALNPTTLGIGGGGGGFNSQQGAGIDVRPDFTGSKAPYMLGYSNEFTITLSGTSVALVGFGGNVGTTTIPKVTYGMRLTADDGKTAGIYKGSYTTNLKPNYGLSQHAVSLSPLPEAGTYRMDPVFIVTENGKDSLYEAKMPPAMQGKYSLVVSGSSAQLKAKADADVQITNFACTTPLFYGANFGISATYTNPTQSEFYKEIYLGWFDTSDNFLGVGDALMTDVLPEEERQVNIALAVPTSVTYSTSVTKSLSVGSSYKIAFLVPTSSGAYRRISDYVNVTINPAQSTSSITLAASGLQVLNSSAADATNIQFELNVKATGGYYTSPIYYWVREDGTVKASGATDPVLVAPNETKKVDWRFPLDRAEIGKTYELVLNYRTSSNKYLGTTHFTVNTVGVDAVDASSDAFEIRIEDNLAHISAPSPISVVDIYNIQGMHAGSHDMAGQSQGTIDLSALPAGVYVMKIIAGGTSHIVKIMR